MSRLVLSRLQPAVSAGSWAAARSWYAQQDWSPNSRSAARQRLPSLPRDAEDSLQTERLLTAHVATCDECHDEPCDTLAALAYLVLTKHNPSDWSSDPTLPQRKLSTRQRQRPRAATNMSEAHATFLTDKFSEWRDRNVVSPATGANSTPVFVIDKAVPKAGHESDFGQWIRQQTPSALRSWAEGKGFPDAPPMCKLKRRPIFDLRQVNAEHTVKLGMRFKSTTEACAHAAPGCLLGAIDYSEGYTSVAVTDDAHNLVSTVGGATWRHNRLPFGYWAAPAIFCLISGEVARQAKTLYLEEGDYVQTYIDDTLVVLCPGETTAEARFDAMVDHAQHVGFRVHPGKLQRPGKTVEYLGTILRVDADAPTLTLPSHKVVGLCTMLSLAVQHETWPQKFWDRLLGKLQAAAPLIPGSGPRLGTIRAGCHAQSYRTQTVHSMVTLTDSTRTALQWVHDKIMENVGKKCNPWAPVRIVGTGRAFTDASGEGGLGGVLLLSTTHGPGVRPLTFSFRSPTSAAFADNKFSTVLELMAIHAALRSATRYWARTQGQVQDGSFLLHVTTDNKAARDLLTRGYSNRNVAVNAEITKIQDTCETYRVVLTVDWVPREQNQVADALSHPDASRAKRVMTALATSAHSVHDLPRLLTSLDASVYS